MVEDGEMLADVAPEGEATLRFPNPTAFLAGAFDPLAPRAFFAFFAFLLDTFARFASGFSERASPGFATASLGGAPPTPFSALRCSLLNLE